MRASFRLAVRCSEAECTKPCKRLFLPKELCIVVLSLCVETAPTCLSSTSSIKPIFVVLYIVIGLSVGLHSRMGILIHWIQVGI